MGEIPLEIPQDGRQPAGGDAVVAADGQFSLFQALQAGTAFLDLSGPLQQFPDGRQQVLPFQSQLHTLGTALEQGQSQFPFQSVQYPGKT